MHKSMYKELIRFALIVLFFSNMVRDGLAKSAFPAFPLTEQELAETREDLSSVTDENIPDGFDGGVLFEGIIEKEITTKQQQRSHSRVWRCKPLHYFGKTKHSMHPVKIMTSSNEKQGGVDLIIGHHYRFSALPEKFTGYRNKLFIWNGTVIDMTAK